MSGLTIIPLNYELPGTVRSIQRGWQASLQSCGVISALFCLLAFHGLDYWSNADHYDPGHALQWGQPILIKLSYASLFLNVSACFSAVFLLDTLGELAYRSAQIPGLKQIGTVNMNSQSVLELFGIGPLWYWVAVHWLLCFMSGIILFLIQIAIYVWIQEAEGIKIGLTCLLGFTALPFLAFFLSPFIRFFTAAGRSTVASHRRAPSTVRSPLSPYPVFPGTPPPILNDMSLPGTPVVTRPRNGSTTEGRRITRISTGGPDRRSSTLSAQGGFALSIGKLPPPQEGDSSATLAFYPEDGDRKV